MLNKILDVKKAEISALTLPPQENVQPKSFFNALANTKADLALIAEVKKASPSKGLIKEDFHPVEIAKGYEAGGADAISVLTDREFFQGSPDYLISIKHTVSLPILRKDFIIDEKQVEESKRIGADAILLIAEALEPRKLHELYIAAESLSLDVLVEVHSKEALEGILAIFEPKIIGVNNRNLKTFETTINQTKEIASFIPKDSIFVSESGIFTPDDLSFVKNAGANAILVGESLMRASSPEEGIQQLYGGLKVR